MRGANVLGKLRDALPVVVLPVHRYQSAQLLFDRRSESRGSVSLSSFVGGGHPAGRPRKRPEESRDPCSLARIEGVRVGRLVSPPGLTGYVGQPNVGGGAG